MTLKLNMTDQEANAKPYELPPTGVYLCRITDISLETVKKAGDNFGKPYWKMTFTIDEGKYAGIPIITTVMLYEGALWVIKQLCEAIHPEFLDGNAINLPSLENGAPNPDVWLGQLIELKVTKFLEGTVVSSGSRKGETREYDELKIKYRKPSKSDSKSATGLPLPS